MIFTIDRYRNATPAHLLLDSYDPDNVSRIKEQKLLLVQCLVN